MESYLSHGPCDLVTPDGKIIAISPMRSGQRMATISIEHIAENFVGYQVAPDRIFFNIKSTLAQLGLNGTAKQYEWNRPTRSVRVQVELTAIGPFAHAILDLLTESAYIGKLFAADESRRVRNPDYLMRMFGRCDRQGRPLLLLGGLEGSGDLILEKSEGRTVAFIALKQGTLTYDHSIYGFLPTLAKALTKNLSGTRDLLHLHHILQTDATRVADKRNILLVRTAPLHIRTVYARVIDSLLPKGYCHTSASVLQPDTHASGDIYELFGKSDQVLDAIPLEFYTLEPHREHVFFADRDQLIASLEQPKSLFDAFATAPQSDHHLASIFVVKGTQMKNLCEKDWIVRDVRKHDFPGLSHPLRQALIVEKYIEQQPQYPFLQAMETGLITSQGVLLSRHFPTPLLKRMLLSDRVTRCLKGIYFQSPSCTYGDYFSNEDRATLIDLAKFGIPVYWVDKISNQILQYVLRPEKESGMFVPLNLIEDFRKSTVFGVYGSNLLEGDFEHELYALLQGVLAMRNQVNHPLLSKNTPIALLTGGGPGAMEVGNRVARKLNIISCGNIVDFRLKDSSVVREQQANAYIDAKMTYRLDRLVERQSEFFLDIPIFLPGGMGMDFEYALEEVRRKTGSAPATPCLLFGSVDYWSRKVSSRFQLNLETGTIQGSEWVSNCFYCIQTAEQGLSILKKFFDSKLPIGKKGPTYNAGFFTEQATDAMS